MHLDHGVELLGLSQPHPFAHIHGTHHGKSNISTSLKPTLVIVFAQSCYKRIGCNVWQEIYTSTQLIFKCTRVSQLQCSILCVSLPRGTRFHFVSLCS